MQAWIRGQDPGRIGTGRHETFSDDTGAIWDVSTAPAPAPA